MARDVIIALDFHKLGEAQEFMAKFPKGGEKPFVKIGMELFYSGGPEILWDMSYNYRTFLDLKLHDIPNTVERTMEALSEIDFDMVNVHAAGGCEMMRAAVRGLKPREDGYLPTLIAVTQLTSTSPAMLKNELLIDTPMEETVLAYAKNAADCGLKGVVCSPLDAAAIKAKLGPDFLTVCPGVRFADSPADDQKRIMTPEMARKAGCDYIVMGRPITQAADPVAAYQRAVREFRGED